MSSAVIFAEGFGNSRQRNRWQRDEDGALFTSTPLVTDDLKMAFDLTDYLAGSETVSSAAYVDSGVVTSSKSVSSPQVLFTMTGWGETEVQVTLSTGRVVTQIFRIYPPQGRRNRTTDYR